MKAKILLLLLLQLASSQWMLLDQDSPPLLTTDASAKPNMSESSPMWSNGRNLYLLNDQMWKYEINEKRWLWQCPTGITERKYAAYWTMRGIFYLFSGLSDGGIVSNDMWTYDPKSRAVQPIGGNMPTARYGATFWTHEQSNRLYLFGGLSGNTTLSDLYAFDVISRTWSQVSYTGSPDLLPFASATLFGSSNVYLYSNDRLWRLDLSTNIWSQVTVNGGINPPGPVRMHHILWSDGSSVFLYGGESGSKLFGDLWQCAIDSTSGACTWTHLTEKILPPARSSPSYTVDIYGSLFINSGGDAEYNDLWGYGQISELSLLEKLENGLQSSILWAFTAAVLAGFVLLLILGVLLYVCILRCISAKKNHGHTPLIMTRIGKNGEEFVNL